MDLRLVLDTNAYVALRIGDTSALATLESADFIGLPAIVLGELYAGFLAGSRAERNIRELDGFLATAGVEILRLGRAEAERYGALVKALREKGTPIPTNDIWLAACALCANARIMTADRHFSLVPGLVAMAW
ncbi:MAG: PIN domain-containing protein [Spirochaetes bacterium]|nr:PIN domain-containing protein [Spirochaetota bacterium]